jgi:hypothetical protein
MKRALFTTALLALLLCGGVAEGQENLYKPFRIGSIWSVNDSKFASVGDTVIGDITYIKIYRQRGVQAFQFDIAQATYWGACRNDTAERTVYFHVPSGTEIYNASNNLIHVTERDTDLLFYDFSLSHGDTVTCHFFEEEFGNVVRTEVCRVDYGSVYAGQTQTGGGAIQNVFMPFYDNDSIVTVGEEGGYRRIIVKGISQNEETVLWIEGVGSSSGFVSQSDQYLGSDGGVNRLLCFCNSSDECLYTGFDISDDDSTDCFSNGFGSGIRDDVKMRLIAFPSPAHDIIRISSEFPWEGGGHLRIYDTMGRLHYDRAVEIPSNIDVSCYRNGLYILQLFTKENNYSGKFIKQ